MLNVKIVAKSVGSFTAVSYVLCVAFGVLAPGWLHASWLLARCPADRFRDDAYLS